MTTQTSPTLPRWDMTPFFPSLDSPEFAKAFDDAVAGIADLTAGFPAVIAEPDPTAALEKFLLREGEVHEALNYVFAYVSSFVTTNTEDQVAQARLSALKQHSVALEQLEAQVTAWIGSLDLDVAVATSEVCREHEFLLRKTKARSSHLMSPGEEDLAASLGPSGPSAWAQLHDDLTSQIRVAVDLDGKSQVLPMSAVRILAMNADRGIRKHAYESELSAWDAWRVPIAAALNGIKGSVITLSKRRGWESPLDESLFGNNGDRATLDAMMTAARESYPDFRRYLRAKAKLLGQPKLAWYDMFAPIATEDRAWTWTEARDFLLENFGTFSPKLQQFTARAFDENWIDAEPRPGKVGGAFCMEVRGDQSRILSNYNPSFDAVSTLAHELGHGYHNLCLCDKPILLRSSPMTLAETASIFCETIVRNAAVRSASQNEQLIILEGALQGSCQVVVDIASRFEFEQSVFAGRADRELSPQEFSDLMLDAQEMTYGDGLDPEIRHKYMWAVKGHYYSSSSFYNYPYMFGLLFGLGLYSRYQIDPDEFKTQYDALLGSTGSADAATLAARFGIDIRTPDFWRGSLDVIRQDVAKFEAIVEERTGTA